MLRTSFLAFLAIAVLGASAVFVGRKEGNGIRGHLMLGANKCTWGPGYWCKNISTTHECGAIHHCVTKQWNSVDLPADHTSPCEMCMNTLTSMDTVLKANLTVDVIEGVLDEICTSVYIPAKVCEKYLDPYVVEIHEALVNNIKPQVICNKIHFCNNEEGVGKTYQRLAVTMGVSAGQTEASQQQTLSDSALAAVMPLGPVILTGDSKAVYGGESKANSGDNAQAVAPLTCSDGQVFWCKSLENAKKCNAVEHCKQVVWAHEKNSPLNPEISAPHPDSTASPLSSSPLVFTRIPSTSVECSRGQTFWCQDLPSAASCQAVPHCIQSVWQHMRVTQDTDDVCKICKDMVKQARDQLTSNQTQEDLKAVFEGSCNLMPIKVVREGCDKLVDDFVPELVEVLSSQMNPDVVCSVAGLCNNAAIDKLLLSSASPVAAPTTTTVSPADDNSDCRNCADFADLLTKKFNSASAQDMNNVFRSFCSEFSSLSDVCLRVVNTYGPEWYNSLRVYFAQGLVKSRHYPFSVLNMCRVNNMCTNQTIPSMSGSTKPAAVISVEVSHKSETGVLSRETAATGGDDLPCSLCDQLVKHLRDILVANTTQDEFKEVLQGICKQTGAFSAQCLDLVNQYYAPVYTFLTTELNPNVICVDVGLCPKKPTVVFNNMDLLAAMPIIPMHVAPVKQLPLHVHNSEEELENSEEFHMKVAEPASPQVMIESTTKPACTICEYVLHFVQEQVADGKNEKKILAAMNDACHQMPGEFATECNQFVQEYGPAFIALVIQQIDPSQVCPKLKVCSSTAKAPMSFAENQSSQGACPLCLLTMQALDDSVLNNKTEENIKQKLDKICSTLPKHLQSDCDRFVNLYYDELIDMLVAETTPQEICVYIRLCMPPKRLIQETPVDSSISSEKSGNNSQVCIMCEFIMTHIDKIIRDKKTEEEIKHAVHGVCRLMPKSVKQECDDFVNQYADLIIQLLSQSISPREVCQTLGVCKPSNNKQDTTAAVVVTPSKQSVNDSTGCTLCEFIMTHLDKTLQDKKTDEEIKHAVLSVCHALPKSMKPKCSAFVNQYADMIILLISESVTPKQMCEALGVCQPNKTPVTECAVCEDAMSHLDDVLADPSVNNMQTALDKVCYHVAKTEFDDCNKFILKFGTKILTIQDSTPSYLICARIKVCPATGGRLAHVDEASVAVTSTRNPAVTEASVVTSLGDLHASQSLSGETESQGSKCIFTDCTVELYMAMIGVVLLMTTVLSVHMLRKVFRRSPLSNMRPNDGLPTYEKLYQPTTIPSHVADDFSATFVR